MACIQEFNSVQLIIICPEDLDLPEDASDIYYDDDEIAFQLEHVN